MTYLDKILYLYPNIQGVSYWNVQYDGTPWNDPYDGIVWENKNINKPSKATLDACDPVAVQNNINTKNKSARDGIMSQNLAIVSNYHSYLLNNPGVSFSQYLDQLETLQSGMNLS